jgi:predicted phosphoribosyltransferase
VGVHHAGLLHEVHKMEGHNGGTRACVDRVECKYVPSCYFSVFLIFKDMSKLVQSEPNKLLQKL